MMLSLLLTVAIGAGTYVMYMKSSVSGAGGSPMAAISLTTVKMQLVQVAEAEKTYNVQNSSYATIEQLASSGWLKLKDPDPTNYDYTVEVTPDGFTATAHHQEVKGGETKDYPTMSIDQSGKVDVKGGD